MNAPIIRNAGLAAVLAASLVSLSSPAIAGHAYGRHAHGHCGHDRVVVRTWCPPPARVIYRPAVCPPRVWVDPSNGLSVSFSGYLGGVAVSGRYDRPLAYGYAYEDPYCGVTFESLEGYAEHCRYHHSAMVQVIAMGGPCERHDWRSRGDDPGDEDWDR